MARQFGIDIDESIIDNILEDLNDLEIKEISSYLEEDANQLKKSAALFVKKILEVQEEIRQIESLMKLQRQERKKIMAELKMTGRFLEEYETEEYAKNRELLRKKLLGSKVEELYKAAFTFHEELNILLNQKVETIIVLQDGGGNPLLFNVSKEEIFDNKILSFEEASKGAGVAARFKTNADKMRQAGIQAIKRDDLNFNDKLNVDKLNVTYKNILYRYDKYKQIVMWLFPANTWNRSKVSARGDIAEAYAGFFLIPQLKYFFDRGLEENINYFMVEGVSKVDNISGLLQGDISRTIGGVSYEYAIKSADASYMSVKQMISLAQKILSNDKSKFVNLKQYKNYLASRKAKIRNPIESSIVKKLSDDIENVLGDVID